MTLEEVDVEMKKRGISLRSVFWTEGLFNVEERKQALADSLEKILNGDFEVSTFDDSDLID